MYLPSAGPFTGPGRVSCFSFLPEGSLPLSSSFFLAVKNRDLIWGFCPLEEMRLGALEHRCRCPQSLARDTPAGTFGLMHPELNLALSQKSAPPAVTISAPLPYEGTETWRFWETTGWHCPEAHLRLASESRAIFSVYMGGPRLDH